MKSILSLIISGALIVSGFGQTRNVLVGTNNAVVQPTNFWSADASNARSGLGLGTSATNPASAFQQSSATLSNLASSNGGVLTNLRATNIVGLIPTSNIPSILLTNIGTITIAQGGTGATNAANARQNLGSTTVGDAVFVATNAETARTAIGALANNGDASSLTNFPASLLRTNGSAIGLTNFPSSLLTINGNAAFLTNITAANIAGTVALASNVTGTIAISNGGSGATTAGRARTNLELGVTNAVQFGSLSVASGDLYLGANGEIGWSGVVRYKPETQTFYGDVYFDNGSLAIFGSNATEKIAATRTNFGLGATWLTNTNVTNFRTAIGLGTNAQPVFDGALITGDLFAGSLEVAFGSNSTIVTTDGIEFTGSHAATTRTNLGLGWTALTNTNAGTGLVSVNTNGDVVSPTNFWQRAPIQTTVQDFTGITVSQTNNATNARNVYVYSLATNVSGISNTIILPTNVSTFNGDEVCVVHKGTTNTTTVVRQAGSTNNLITLNRFDESVKFIRELGQWDFYHNISFVEPIQFSGTNAVANVAASRTNLGISLAALTNTNNATFQEAIFTTNAAPTNAGNFGNHAAWMGVSIVTNGVTNTFLIPLYK